MRAPLLASRCSSRSHRFALAPWPSPLAVRWGWLGCTWRIHSLAEQLLPAASVLTPLFPFQPPLCCSSAWASGRNSPLTWLRSVAPNSVISR